MVESVFLMMNCYWSDEEYTLEAVMRVKVNMEETSLKLNDTMLAEKLLSSKHSNAKHK